MIRLIELVPSGVVEGINDANIFKAIFMAGGPGSGKSFIGDQMFGNDFLGAKLINSDEIFEFFLRKENLPFTMDSESDVYDKQMQVRDKARKLNKSRLQTYINSLLPILIDGTGRNYDKIESSVTGLREIGYDVDLVFVNTSLEVALERNAKRDRKVDPNLVKKMWRDTQMNIGKFQTLFGRDRFHVIDNNTAYANDSEELDVIKLKLFKEGRKILTQPLENQRGLKIIDAMKKSGAKYLSDLGDNPEIAQSIAKVTP